ncbi:MAG: hypothetical protein HOP29_07055 [Phycisphaerales bacterium]|nr:hypothetical protein [Phycisphaerales bacterium]
MAARVLDAVEYYGQSRIHAAYRDALKALDGWDRAASRRKGQWRFAAMSGSAGESGDAMLYQFRIANGLDSKQMNELFVSRSDLFRQPLLPEDDPHKLGRDDVVVLLDDFSGTGTQVCDAWNNPETSFGALLAGVGRVYLVVVVASKAARNRIADETSISLVSAHELRESDDVFSDHCKYFTKADRVRLLHYGRIADEKCPKGFGECGFVVVFQHRSPNNSIPILHADHPKWTGLFPRHD